MVIKNLMTRKIEVIGLTTYQMPLLQAGGHGHCIMQCQTAKITTKKTIPVQIDGEAVRINPCTIELSFLNQANMLAKKKKGRVSNRIEDAGEARVNICKINMVDYESHCFDKNTLQEISVKVGQVVVDYKTELSDIRQAVKEVYSTKNDWVFIDSISTDRFFRIVLDHEKLHYLSDICEDNLYILENDPEAKAKKEAEESGAENGKKAEEHVNNLNKILEQKQQAIQNSNDASAVPPTPKKTPGRQKKNDATVIQSANSLAPADQPGGDPSTPADTLLPPPSSGRPEVSF